MTTMKEQAIHWRTLARKYHAFGLNVLPLGSDKQPVVTGIATNGAPMRFKWEAWIDKRQDDKLFDVILSQKWWGDVRGVAALAGAVSRGLVVLDGDHADIETARQCLHVLGLPDAYEWFNPSGSGDGWHCYVLCPDWQQDKAKVDRDAIGGGHVELRWRGSYTALPGSVHPSGSTYPGNPAAAPQEVTAAALTAFFDAITVAPSKTTRTTTTTTTTRPAPSIGGTAYGLRALAAAVDAVRQAPQGRRNDELNRKAKPLGELVGGGELDRAHVEAELAAAALAAGLGDAEIAATLRSALDAGEREPRTAPDDGGRPSPTWGGDGDVTGDDAAAIGLGDGESTRNTWPYAIKDGRTVFQFMTKEGVDHAVIAHFTARITEESRIAETPDVVYTIEGEGKRSGSFTCQIGGADFLSPAKLQAAITQAAGPYDPVNPDHARRLPAAIQTMTEDVIRTTTHRRTGWADGRFLIDGNLPDGVKLDMPRKLAYSVDHDGDIAKGVDALRYFLQAVTPARGTIILSHLLAAPMAFHAGWRGERSTLAIVGRTGSLKTSAAMLAMGLYGAEMTSEDTLLTWGQGATVNAVLEMAAAAGDLPMLIDNYKPNTGNGEKDFADVMHAISEGSTKSRVTRGGDLRPSKPIHCWPVITGEDRPGKDAASIARTLLLDWPENGVDKTLLAHAQRLAAHLSVVGAAWLRWLESPDGQRIAKEAGGALASKRTQWGDYLAQERADLANPLRVSTNLAIHEIVWRALTQFAPLATLARELTPALVEGLRGCASNMAAATADTREVTRFLNGLREALATGAALLGGKFEETSGFTQQNADRYIGWYGDINGKAGAYLYPERARQVVSRFINDDLSGISQRSLGDQLKAGGWLVRTDEKTGYTQILVKINGKPSRVWHVTAAALAHQDTTQGGLDELGI
jgi:hypothetical protein